MKLAISDDLNLPLDAATQTFAFIGRKRSGKTYAAGKLAELLLSASVQVVILDTVGNWYGLRLSATGKKPSAFDVPIFGGLRGDIALNVQAGELIADVLADTGRSAILDLSQFTGADRKRFATAFGERLWQRKKAESHPSPVHLIIEECQLIIPQFVGKDEARMVGIYEQIVRLGGNYGVGISMITQRPQSVNKEALTQTECLFVFQVNGVPERKAIREWVTHQGLDVHLVDELPSLEVGTAYVWSPQWLNVLKKVRVAAKETFDASSTPRVGEHQERRNPPPLDLKDLGERIASIVEESKANDPHELKRRIAELEKQLREQKPQTRVEEIRVPCLSDEELEGVRQFIDAMKHLQDASGSVVTDLNKLSVRLVAAIEKSASPRQDRPKREVASPPPRQTRAAVHSETNGDITGVGHGGLRRILIALAQRNGLSARQLGVRAGLSSSSGTFGTYLATARRNGWIDGGRDCLLVTEEGLAALGVYEPLPTGRELCAYWLKELGGGAARILQVLVEAYPQSLSKQACGEHAGLSAESGTFGTYLSKLRTLELIEGKGELRASAELFD